MYESTRTVFATIGVKIAIALHFILEFLEEILNKPMSDLLQNTTSVISLVFILLKSRETYLNIKAKKNADTKN